MATYNKDDSAKKEIAAKKAAMDAAYKAFVANPYKLARTALEEAAYAYSEAVKRYDS